MEGGDDLLSPRFKTRLIEMSTLEIAGWTGGTERPGQTFLDMLVSSMDEPPAGAIGATVLQHFSQHDDRLPERGRLVSLRP